jgi:hypothetical protein
MGRERLFRINIYHHEAHEGHEEDMEPQIHANGRGFQKKMVGIAQPN